MTSRRVAVVAALVALLMSFSSPAFAGYCGTGARATPFGVYTYVAHAWGKPGYLTVSYRGWFSSTPRYLPACKPKSSRR